MGRVGLQGVNIKSSTLRGRERRKRDDMWVVKIPRMSTAPAADLWLCAASGGKRRAVNKSRS